MKADSFRITKVFSGGGDIHYLLPHFQREYAWDRAQWQTLLSDAIELHDEMGPLSPNAATPERELEHFLGALVVISDGTRHGTMPAFKLVDGQQRLTSVSLLLCALMRVAERQGSTVLARRTRKLLVNADEEGDLFYKLLPTTKYGDRSAYTAILRGEPPPVPCDSRIPQALDYFFAELQTKVAAGTLDPERFFQVLTHCFQVVFIDLNRDESPYRIFESLNGKGKALTQADLVRNYIAMRLPADDQEKVFEKHWAKVEGTLQERRLVGRSRLGELTAFLRHYLAMRTGVLCSEEHVYARFRDRAERDFSSDALFAGEVSALAQFAAYYNKLLRPEQEADLRIRESLERLSVLEVSTAFPFLLAVLDAYNSHILTREQLLGILTTVENYIVRRVLAGEATNFLNKLFPGLWGQIDKANPVDSLRLLLAVRGYPSDARLRAALATRSLYDKSELTRSRTALVLETINRHLSSGSGGYTVLSGAASIEHVMPQSAGPDWLDELGDGAEETHRELLHTLGNLTLVTQEWNSSLSNAPFAIKRKKLAAHALKLNADYFGREDVTAWDASAIRERASYLTDQIIAIWPSMGGAAIDGKTGASSTSTSVAFHQEVVDHVGQYLRLSFVKHEAGQLTRVTADGNTRLIVAASKRYERSGTVLYWFAFHPSQRTFLEGAPNAYIAFGCGSAEKIVLFPLADFLPYVENMGATKKEDRFYNHVQIQEGGRGTLLLAQPTLGVGTKTDISVYHLKNNGGAK